MGLMTLADFRDDLDTALGEINLTSSRKDRYINAGYYDLTGAIMFEILSNDEDIATVDGNNYIVAPTNTLAIVTVWDSTNDNLLAWLPKSEYYRRLQTSTGKPTHWTRHKDNILLHPVPDGAYTLTVFTIEPPAPLSSSGDTTVLPSMWDVAIFQLSVHHALLSRGEEQRAAAWLARAINYIGSRITEQDFHASIRGIESSIPQGMEALRARLEGSQGGQ